MQREINCLMKNKTWKLVQRPKENKVFDVKWIFTTKADNSKKARLVVRGFQQEDGLDDLYSPIARILIGSPKVGRQLGRRPYRRS